MKRKQLDLFSALRRAFAHYAEVLFIGSIADALGLAPGFIELIQEGRNLGFGALIALAASFVYEMLVVSISPDTRPEPCKKDDSGINNV